MTINELDFLHESNLIESEPSGVALLDSARAWEYICSHKTLTFSNILTIHDLLMNNLNPGIAGQIRKVGVWIGGKPAKNPASVTFALMELLETKPKTWKEIKQWHIDFEEIHPFEDGNGRTGRILMNWQMKINDLPIKIIHHGQEQMEYYDWFQ